MRNGLHKRRHNAPKHSTYPAGPTHCAFTRAILFLSPLCMIQYWLCYGKQDKWQAALEYSKWGVKELATNGKISSPARDWERVQNDDVLIFLLGDSLLYGYGIVTGKSDKEIERIWPDEVAEKKVIYNRRLDVAFTEACTSDRSPVPIETMEAPGHAGLSEISEQEAQRAMSEMNSVWNIL